jgi:hypothetical protein
MGTRSRGDEWLQQRGITNEPFRVSKYYVSSESWTGKPVWFFEFPETLVSDDSAEYLHLLCEKTSASDEFHHLRVPISIFPACKHHLAFREDTKMFSLWLSAEPETLFREMRGQGSIEFRGFEHRCSGA